MTTYHMDIANFNLTYGNDELPMLEHFEDFVYPAFTAGYTREYEDSAFSFLNVQVVNTEFGLALTGIIIMDTNLKVVSVLNDQTNQLEEKNESYPTSPYSLFYIFLKNHRMIFVPNQKGSPRLRSFGRTVDYVLKKYRKDTNAKLPRDSKLPIIRLSVVGIANTDSVAEALQNVDKITSLAIRFYPLNGEDFSELNDASDNLLQTMQNMRKAVDSKTANTTINSPKNKKAVAHVVENLNGKAAPTMKVNYGNGQKGIIKNESVAQRVEFELEGDQSLDRQGEILSEARKVDALKVRSKINTQLYNRHYNSLNNLK